MLSLRSTPRFASLVSLAGAAAAALLVASPAVAQELRFTTTQPGNVIATGNALGLAKAAAQNGPGKNDSIGTFISLDAASVDSTPANPLNPWGGNTTGTWQNNGSAATINFPNESQILYAELIWGGGYNFGGEDVTASLNTPVKLGFGGATTMVTPDPASAVTVNQFVPNGNFNANYYMRSADVTTFVAAHGSGQYTVAGVPSVQSLTIESLNAAGWTLVVAYRYDNEPIRNMTVFVGSDGKFVDENTTVDYTVDGFCAPPSGDVTGTLAVSAMEGDANRSGDSLKIGQTVGGSFATLSGPNNPANNFFCSAINDSKGNVDLFGTYGMANHIPQNPPATAQVTGGRQGWDVTTVGVSSMASQLFPGQKSAVIRTSTQGDSFMPVLSAFAIDVNAPKFLYDQSTTTVDTNLVHPGDTLHFTAKLVNEGKAPASGVDFTLAVPNGLQLSSFQTNGVTGDINGMAVTPNKLTSGVPMGTIGVAQSRTVDVVFNVTTGLPATFVLKPVWNYSYTICTGDPSTDEQFNGQGRTVNFEDNTTMSTSSSSSTASSMATTSSVGGMGGMGGAASSNGGAGGANANAGPTAFAQGNGIFCSASTGSTEDWGGAIAVLGIALAAAARRRPSRRA